MNGAYLCFTFIHHKPGFPGWLSCTAQVVLFFFCLEKQHLFCYHDYRTEIFRFRVRYLAQTTSLVDLYKGRNLEADKADLNGPILVADLVWETLTCKYYTCGQQPVSHIAPLDQSIILA